MLQLLRFRTLVRFIPLLFLAPLVGASAPMMADPIDMMPDLAIPGTVAPLALQQEWPASSLEAAVGQAAALLEVSVIQGSHPSPHTVAGIPEGLAQPVGILLAAIEAAEPWTRAAVDPANYDALMAHERAFDAPQVIRAGDLQLPAAMDRTTHDAARALVNQEAGIRAAAILANAIDAALPGLRAYASTASVGTGTGCDVAERLPVLCIGSAASGTYSSDAALLIDLGGDDVHAHSAGAADPLKFRPVSITIDLGGNDVYETTVVPAHGSGVLGGIGILVDEAGDDAYLVHSDTPSASASGHGYGATGGSGILWDGSGNDRYELISTGYVVSFAAGQGRATNGVLGILMDGGAGTDAYTIRAVHPHAYEDEEGLKVGGLNANGQGLAAIGGVGILADGGGHGDSVTLEAIAARVADDEMRPIVQIPITLPAGQGMGQLAGIGILATGNGDGTVTAHSRAVAPWAAVVGVNVQGMALSEGIGILRDAGGNDDYWAVALSSGRHTAPEARATMAIPNWAASMVRAQGSSGESGIAILADAGGDDTYTAFSHAIARATGDTSARATANAVTVAAQGAATGGFALLDDEGGHDSHVIITASHAIAEVAGGNDAIAVSDNVLASGQAASGSSGFQPGTAVLRNTGGGDNYLAMAISQADAPTGSEGTVYGTFQGATRGTGIAFLHDSDDGEEDSFNAYPGGSTCLGTRGQGEWRDCGSGLGIGRVD